MHSRLSTYLSILALSLSVAGYATVSEADDHGGRCNVLLDGDGEPIRDEDDNTIDHENSRDCKNEEVEAKAEEEEEEEVVEATEEAEEKPAPPKVEPLVVFFEVNERELSTATAAQIDSFGKLLRQTRPERVDVIGYTDSSGSPDYNKELSGARAGAVARALIDSGLPSGVIVQSASGEGNLAVDTPDDTREDYNRRVTITPTY